MSEPDCVGALIRDSKNRVYAHRRTNDRALLPGTWDIVGGHLEPGELALMALAREIEEETGWRLRRVEAVLADWEWTMNGRRRREIDYLVEIDGDLTAPRLEEGKHDAYEWIGPDNLDAMMRGRTDGDRRLRDIVAKAVRTRLTPRLRLEPIGPDHAEDLRRLHDDDGVAYWYGERWDADYARTRAEGFQRSWDTDGIGKWIAYDRITNELIGRGGASWIELAGRRQVELGWALRSPYWKQGYASEIGAAGLAYAFGDLGMGEVMAFTECHNRRSRAVMERLGMTYSHEVRHPGLLPGSADIHDDAPFAVYVLTAPGSTALGAGT